MISASLNKDEATGCDFSIKAMLQARQHSIDAVNTIATQIKPGMSEQEAQDIAHQHLIDKDMDRYWHPTKIRFGKNTLKTFREFSDPEVILGKNDIFFIDIGPVFNGHEGDYGDTFTTGRNTLMQDASRFARSLFQQVRDAWDSDKLSGEALYHYAEQQAKQKGWVLNLNTKGHRVSDFPHAIYKATKLNNFQDFPNSGLWILEIQIAHPEQPFGAFFEDMLLGNSA